MHYTPSSAARSLSTQKSDDIGIVVPDIFNPFYARVLAGGRGALTGTVLGMLLMVLITNAGTAFKIDPYIPEILTGILIIFAVAMDMIKSRKKA